MTVIDVAFYVCGKGIHNGGFTVCSPLYVIHTSEESRKYRSYINDIIYEVYFYKHYFVAQLDALPLSVDWKRITMDCIIITILLTCVQVVNVK